MVLVIEASPSALVGGGCTQKAPEVCASGVLRLSGLRSLGIAIALGDLPANPVINFVFGPTDGLRSQRDRARECAVGDSFVKGGVFESGSILNGRTTKNFHQTVLRTSRGQMRHRSEQFTEKGSAGSD